MLVLCVISVFSLLSVGLAAPLSCEDLLRPLETNITNHILGKWISIAESTEVPGGREYAAKEWITGWLQVSPGLQNNTVKELQMFNIGGKCFSMTTEMIMENNTFTSTGPLSFSLTYLNTCPDCLLAHHKLSLVNNYSSLNIFSKRKELTSAELEVFKKQVDCLNLPPAVYTNPQKDSCPDTTQDNSKTLDLSKVMELLGDKIDLQKTLEEIISKLQLESNKAN
ncbi:uncharacterized protein [Salmo salar]|uniref:Apolipoprotein M n=1 Tax=Salmo salar TaxID=8030 RepID=A0A1S3M8M8_SALSA|nr:uncharacterized protein LOC106571128 [Salmo salar]|eukprot:XP_013999311.1 PREDICTED: uncharacterized protein LOC106571128 [Salmo salar]